MNLVLGICREMGYALEPPGDCHHTHCSGMETVRMPPNIITSRIAAPATISTKTSIVQQSTHQTSKAKLEKE